MIPDTIEVSITYDKTIKFFLRMAGISEEQEFRQRIFGLDEKERAEKEYGTNVALLMQLAVKKTEGLFPNRPKEPSSNDKTIYSEDFRTSAEEIGKFFADKTVLKERIAYFAVRAYFLKLSPSENFF